jgi:hypothetical protein
LLFSYALFHYSFLLSVRRLSLPHSVLCVSYSSLYLDSTLASTVCV